MPFYHLVLIALIQGITEFLPVSSSGHLILLPSLTKLGDQGALIDVAAHIGTLFAVIIYFWIDVKQVLRAVPKVLRGQFTSPATIPVICVGAILKVTGLSETMRSISVIGWAMLIFGLLLYFVDQRTTLHRELKTLTLPDAIKLGLWQAIALIPGTSRSGITITGALWAGFTRKEAARISMLMSIPTIVASGSLTSFDLIGGHVPLRDISIVILFSFVSALLALSLMMRLLNTISYTPYVVYRVFLGSVLIVLGYTNVLGF